MKRRGLLNIHFCKNNSQISPLRQKKIANFHFFHYKSMGTISCHRNQSSYPTGIKNIPFRSPYLRMQVCNMERIGLTVSEEMSFENVDGRWTDGYLYILLAYHEPTAQVS